MQRALLYCEYAYEIDFDGEYGISEIVRYLDELDFNNDYFREFPLLLESIIQDISAIKAWELQKGAGGWPLYSHLEELQKASHQMNNIVNKQQKISVLKMLVLSSIEIFDEINKIRNKNIKYSISKENDEWLKELRRSNSKNGEKINAQY